MKLPARHVEGAEGREVRRAHLTIDDRKPPARELRDQMRERDF